ncbi:ATP-binding protein [Vaginella massiliensis]|uniref:sensor histidine kinase n=1 Tax=Vaginella massiliensis TaxID=1816680 RepID=UPI000839A46D|nr:HAMP domain-containing sensor histidine kinase [Vaginella massiliensis]
MTKKNRTIKTSLSLRIFLGMFGVIIVIAISILIITINHYSQQTNQYHLDLLQRKEQTVLALIDYEIIDYSLGEDKEDILDVLQSKILKFQDISKMDIIIYDVRGNFIESTQVRPPKYKVIPTAILKKLDQKGYYRDYPTPDEKGDNLYSTFNYLKDVRGERIGIINLPYYTDNSFLEEDKQSLLKLFGAVLLFVIVFGGLISWRISRQITNRLRMFANKILDTHVVGNTRPLDYQGNDEIRILVDSYNEMLQKLKEQSEQIATIEREEAWRDLAKQVAHEVKNPLTPMKLMIQNYARKFDPNDEQLEEKTKALTTTLLDQINTISTMAEAFSDFAKIPDRNDENTDIVAAVENCLSIFPQKYISFSSTEPEIIHRIDKVYLNRIITNLTKNAIQSVPSDRIPDIRISVERKAERIVLKIADNGNGIPKEIGNKIFTPKFTTKNSGMGIGLSMVKKIIEDYNGVIRFVSEEGKGTTFIISLPLNE